MWDQIYLFISTYVNGEKVLGTSTLFAIFFLLRLIFSTIIAKNKFLELEQKRKWSVNVGSVFTFLLFVSVVGLWANEIRTLAISLIALAVALTIATKELLLCVCGGIFRATNNAFHLGDRIEINGIRGDVIDRTILATKVLEVGPGNKTHQLTGRSVTIPNSLFLTNQVVNESFLKNYVLHTFTVPLPLKSDWEEAEKILLEAANERCSQYFDRATRYIDKVQKRANLETPKLEPRVHINIVDHQQLQLIVRVTVPSFEKGKAEQDIIKFFLKRFKAWDNES